MMTTLHLFLSFFLLLSCGKYSYALPLVIGSILLLFVIYVSIRLIKKNKFIREQQFHLEKQRKEQAEIEECILLNNALIESLEKQLKESNNDKEFMRSRMEALEVENKILQSQQIPEIERFKTSEVYLRFHNKQEWKVKPEDWQELFQVINAAYPGFAHHLNKRLLKPTIQEIRICYLIKAHVPPGLIAQLLNCSVTNISMTRKRLYEKTHGEKGCSTLFDQFIDKI